MNKSKGSSCSARPIRVAHLATHPIQYNVPLYRKLASRPEIDLTVYYYSDFSLHQFESKDFDDQIKWGVPLLDGYKYRFCASSIGRSTDVLARRPNLDLLAELIRERYDAIWVSSYASINAILARLIASFSGTPIFFRDDTTLLSPRPAWKRAIKKIILYPFLWGAWGLFVGRENERYWLAYGLPKQRLYFTPHCVDNQFFQEKAQELLPRKQELRRRFGITDCAPVILFCGKFIELKQPLLILSAYAKLRRKTPCWLLFVGNGPMRQAIEKQVQQEKIPGVLMPGFLNQQDVAEAYAVCDVLTLCSSSETWGLVVNEAMNFNLPIVVSDRVGCSSDLVRTGWNGFVVPYQDAEALELALSQLVKNESKRREFGVRSREMIASYSIETCSDGIIRAILDATRSGGETSKEKTATPTKKTDRIKRQ